MDPRIRGDDTCFVMQLKAGMTRYFVKQVKTGMTRYFVKQVKAGMTRYFVKQVKTDITHTLSSKRKEGSDDIKNGWHPSLKAGEMRF